MKREFDHFIEENNEISPSIDLDKKVLSFVRADHSSHQVIFAKLFGLQLVVGAMTLLICPQFDLGLGKSFKVFHYIHHTLGMQACYALCGAIFMGPSAFLSLKVLKDCELEKIRRVWPLHFALLAATMLVSLAYFGNTVENQLLFIWFFAAISASVGMFILGRKISSPYARQRSL